MILFQEFQTKLNEIEKNVQSVQRTQQQQKKQQQHQRQQTQQQQQPVHPAEQLSPDQHPLLEPPEDNHNKAQQPIPNRDAMTKGVE